jgi:dihydrofolate reductase
MRKIILMMSISVDGFIEGPNRELDWQMIDEELHSHFNDQLRPMGAFLVGRVTHELMARTWPTFDTDPSSVQQARERGLLRPMLEFAQIWRNMPKIVFSKTLERADGNATIFRDVIPEDIRRLKQEPGGDMVLGGADLAASFMSLDLIDEYWLHVHPIAIGQGKPLFRASQTRINFRFAESRAFGNGVVLLRYERPDEQRRVGHALSRKELLRKAEC